MSTAYVETSAILAWLFGGKRAAEVRRAVDASERVVTSALSFAEVDRALIRAEGGGMLKAGDGQRLRGLGQRARAGWATMAVTDEVLGRAARPFPVEPVRTPDAVHLATALAFARAYSDLRIVSLDRRIIDNAAALGLD